MLKVYFLSLYYPNLVGLWIWLHICKKLVIIPDNNNIGSITLMQQPNIMPTCWCFYLSLNTSSTTKHKSFDKKINMNRV